MHESIGTEHLFRLDFEDEDDMSGFANIFRTSWQLTEDRRISGQAPVFLFQLNFAGSGVEDDPPPPYGAPLPARAAHGL